MKLEENLRDFFFKMMTPLFDKCNLALKTNTDNYRDI